MLILSNVARLYDGSGSSPNSVREGVDVHIDGERLTEIRPHQPDLAVGSGHTKVDCSGLTVTPGLIDCHGHITVLGLDRASMDTMRGSEELLWVERILHTTLVDGGVTTVRDVGGATHRMKRLVEEGTILGPRLLVSICMLSSTGGHADFRGPDRCHATISDLWPEGPGRPSSIVDGPWAARERVRTIAACGADLIKICASPGVASPGDKLEHREFSAEEIEAICDEAEGRGLRVAAHAHSRSGLELAIQHGVHDLQHISFMDERLVDMAHDKGCCVTPTSWVIQALPEADGLSDFVMEKVKQVAEHHASATQYARSGGLPILGGTDPVLPGMHGRNGMELVALMRDGLTSLEAWHGMTGAAARELSLDDTGVLEAGRRADLLVCDGDVIAAPGRLVPEDGPSALVEVFKDGRAHRGGLPGVAPVTWGGRLRDQLVDGR